MVEWSIACSFTCLIEPSLQHFLMDPHRATPSMFKFLLDEGQANPRVVTARHGNALHTAAELGNTDVARILLEHAKRKNLHITELVRAHCTWTDAVCCIPSKCTAILHAV